MTERHNNVYCKSQNNLLIVSSSLISSRQDGKCIKTMVSTNNKQNKIYSLVCPIALPAWPMPQDIFSTTLYQWSVWVWYYSCFILLISTIVILD